MFASGHPLQVPAEAASSTLLYLFDDEVARGWDPFVWTRPAGELLFGALLLRERAEGFWGLPCRGHLTHALLEGWREEGAPPVVSATGPEGGAAAGRRILVSSRWVPRGSLPAWLQDPRGGGRGPERAGADPRAAEAGRRHREGAPAARLSLAAESAGPGEYPSGVVTLLVGGEAVGWILPPGVMDPPPDLLLRPAPWVPSTPVRLEGTLLGAPWELMAENSRQLLEDIPRLFPGYAAEELPGSFLLGDGLLSLGRGVEVEPGCVFDLRKGPIRLSDGVVVRAFTRLAGPAYVGPGTTLLGGSLAEVSLGPRCKVKGEVETSVFLGYSNKAHDGFLGHAYVGRWVNLGALTTNSDLKNTYGTVRVGGRHGGRETGLLKVGCFLGDHVKTGIGTLLNTGTVVGAGSNLFGGGMPPTWVPPFSWGKGDDLGLHRLEKFLETARLAMGRRGVELTPDLEAVFRRIWEAAARQRTGAA